VVLRRGRVIGLLALLALALTAASPAHGETLPNGFQDSVAFSGLQEPTALRFSPDGRVFVAQKSGQVLVFDDLEDSTPTLFADLAKQVYDHGDRGLLALALDPDFPSRPYVYALYTYNHVLGEDPDGAFPRWPSGGSDYVGDYCPKPADADVDDCPVSGRLVRLTAVGDHAEESGGAAAEHLLVEGWCQQTSSHSVGDLEFGPEGALFASGGEGASFTTPDYGEVGWPHKNQCGDPPGGEALAPPSAEGGSLRAQDVRTGADPTGLSGTVIRIDPDTGAPWPGNPFATAPGADANARRIVGFGFRNPFRFTINSETDELYVDNVGGGPYEEIDRLSTSPGSAYNSGWPCFEADGPNPNFQSLGLSLCESLYAAPGSTSDPFFFYNHAHGVSAEDTCPNGSGSDITGSIFYEGDDFPVSYDGAFFFADSVFGCIYVMFPDADGRPDPSTVSPFLTDGGLYPGVDIQVGPDGALYYASLFSEGFGPGAVHRVAYFSGNRPPVARLTATPHWGAGTIHPTFDATGSTDADGEALSYEWDLEGDGSYEPPTSQGSREVTFSDSQNHTVAVRVKDPQGASSIARTTVFPGDTPPQAEILSPEESPSEPGKSTLTWAVGQQIDFSGAAEDAEDGQLPATRLDWSSRLYHCPNGPSGCHAHPLQAFPALAEGHLTAPDHEYPSRIELRLTATDSRGLSATRAIEVYPTAVDLKIASDPAGITLTAGPLTAPGPFTLTAIEGSTLTLSAPETVEIDDKEFTWEGWSDGGSRVHTVVAGGAIGEYTAAYETEGPPDGEGPPKGTPAQSGPPTAAQSPLVTAPPRTRLLGHPPKRGEEGRARFAFGADPEAASFYCRLDRAPYRPCRSPRAYAGLAPGPHVFKVIAGDADNRFDPSPASFRWRILR
jgi:glucose/arabinose dehydrogenase